jgi:hypothetical protein
MLKEKDVLEKGIQLLRDCLSEIPSMSVETIERLRSETEPDFCVMVRGIHVDQPIYVEVKFQGTPKSTRNAVNALLQYLRNYPSAYGIFIAPYISPRSARICETAGIGFLDLSGNCRIAFQQVFVSRESFPNKYTSKTGLSSLYSPKSERVLRVLLTFPYRSWKTIELAEEAQVSPGMITHIRKKIEGEEWSETTSEGLRLVKPDELLQDWSKNYSLQRNTLFDFYTMKPLLEIEKEIAETCSRLNITYALTGFSASNRLAPMVRNQRVMAYVDQDIDLLADKLGLKTVNSGANVSLYKPYDAGVLWKAQEVDGIQIATPIQIYLDLKNLRSRGEEAADFLYKEVIQESWQHQKSNTTVSS